MQKSGRSCFYGERGARPGLPRLRSRGLRGRGKERRQQRVQLVVIGQWHQRVQLELQPDVARSQQRAQPRPRLSGAVPPAFIGVPVLDIGSVPGYRNTAGGALTGVGNYGSVWSASVAGANGLELMFLAADLSPGHGTYRGHALQVRCLQHLSGLLSFLYWVMAGGVSGSGVAVRGCVSERRPRGISPVDFGQRDQWCRVVIQHRLPRPTCLG